MSKQDEANDHWCFNIDINLWDVLHHDRLGKQFTVKTKNG